eukprot:m.77526 g.77526  ORF g.77526 m.77526 type:complete len:98 (+) comp36041_c0_seq1:2059-2352(+)
MARISADYSVGWRTGKTVTWRKQIELRVVGFVGIGVSPVIVDLAPVAIMLIRTQRLICRLVRSRRRLMPYHKLNAGIGKTAEAARMGNAAVLHMCDA